MANDIKKAEDQLNKALEESGQPLGGTINTDEDDLFTAMMDEAEEE